ncbi:UDP-N-acetylmuramoyl-L-alanine--D-glutamate ligase [Gemmatimonas sp.]|uniref:UDP-N-acetylmuramoyl-L-alanine--D-glutamate ligase n=1 Tax=Gemmatimonas sp. TaxID=1962908 RepID=UPI00286B5781|nr:UDP-N-acetylmuramoyl-L-alanine--D-glutamate ligase [Gemmatimonas sp.]
MGDVRPPQELASIVARRLAERRGEFAVVGLARSGIAAVRLLRAAGCSVYASDASTSEAVRSAGAMLEREGASVDVGVHNVQRIAHCSVLVVSPGIPPTAPPIRAALSAGVPVVSEVEVALRLQPALRYIAVTGTNGKTTTTALIGHLLRALGHDAADVGNIGTPVSELALLSAPPAWAALELSSFQLHDTPGIMPDVGVLTTLSPDHLDRYASVAEYYADKKRLFANAVLPSQWVTTADSADVDALVAGIPGHWHRFSVHRTDVDGFYHRGSGMLHLFGEPLVARDRLTLAGDHNVANALAALLAVMAADPLHRIPSARAQLAAAIGTFGALPHRLEPVVDRGGILWLNDSKATNIDSTKVALASMSRPTIVLLGGRHKGESYTALVPELLRTAKVVLAYGEAGALIASDLEAPLHGRVLVEHCGSDRFEQVMTRARALAVAGDVVLLSPACSSYDMFNNYEERGREFARFAGAMA